jgi:MFS family permease
MLSSGNAGGARIASTVGMTVVVQALTALALAVPPILAPVAAPDLGIAPAGVGNWVGFSYMVAMFAGLASGTLVGRWGPVRVFEAAVLCVAAGLAIGSAATLAATVLCGVLLGIAHGFVNPASSTILAAAAPPRMRAMIFSIKQTGVPLGAALAGALVPALLLHASWQFTVLLLAAASAALIAVVAPFRSAYDRDRKSGERLRLRGLAAPILEVWRNRPVRHLALTSGVFSSVQMSFGTYLVSYLKLGLGYSLVAAGLMFSAAQLAGVLGRIAWGAVADRWLAPRLLLALLGLVMAACGGAAALFSADWPMAGIVLVCVVYGATAVGWNGVFLAEVARLAPEGRVAIVTGGTQFFTFAGVLIGPPVFGAIVSASGDYGSGFIFIAILPLATGLGLLAQRKAAGMRDRG